MKRRKRKATRPAAIPLPEHIAREIFKLGDLDGKKCHRMAYKVGHWTPDHSQEKENGGLCEAALASVIARCLAEAPSGTDVEVGMTKSGRIHLTLVGDPDHSVGRDRRTEHQTWEVFQAHAEVGEALDGVTPLPEPLLGLKHEQEGSL